MSTVAVWETRARGEESLGGSADAARGGATWTALHLGSPVLALETTGARAYSLVASCRNGRSDCSGPVRLYEAPVGSDDWQPVLDIDVGSPPAPNGSLVVSGRSVYAVV